MFTVDRLGRKALMLLGAGGLAGIFAILGSMYFFHLTGIALTDHGGDGNCLLCHVTGSGNMGHSLGDLPQQDTRSSNVCCNIFALGRLFCAYIYFPAVKPAPEGIRHFLALWNYMSAGILLYP